MKGTKILLNHPTLSPLKNPQGYADLTSKTGMGFNQIVSHLSSKAKSDEKEKSEERLAKLKDASR